MTTLTHPSERFPGPPTVSLDVPDDWEPVHRSGLLLAARLPRDGSFAPNVVVNVEALAPAVHVEALMERMREMAQSRSGHASEPYAAVLGDREFVGLDSTWPDADVETVLQANLFHIIEPPDVERHGGETPAGGPEGGGPDPDPDPVSRPRWLVQLTGAVGGPSAEQDYELIREVIMTTRVTPWRPEGIEGS